MNVRPFRGFRPPAALVEQVQSRPYDVLSSEEARAEAGDNEKSLYHIIKPEINFPEGTDEYDPRVYQSAAEHFQLFQDNGWLVQDAEPMYYLYAQTMQGKTQYGLVVGACVADYLAGNIKKHELTRADKERDRMEHVRVNNANIEPVFFAYQDRPALLALIDRYAQTKPEYDFTAPDDGFRHRFWLISGQDDIRLITDEFALMPALYIADGHHRSAAAALVGAEKAQQNPHHRGDEEYNFFMAVCFPASQLTILDYNRVVKDLGGLSPDQLLKQLAEDFIIADKGTDSYRPQRPHEFSLYLDGHWYALTARAHTYDDTDPVGSLDVSISSEFILKKQLGIGDLRKDKRIDFVGGLRGLGELKRRVDSGEMALALALYPVSMQQIIRIADTGNIMPPKATWFEPKLRSGLIIHKLA